MEEQSKNWREIAAQEAMKMRGYLSSMIWCYRFVDDQVSSGKSASHKEVFRKIQAGRYGYAWNPYMGKDPLTSNPLRITCKRQPDGSYVEEEKTLFLNPLTKSVPELFCGIRCSLSDEATEFSNLSGLSMNLDLKTLKILHQGAYTLLNVETGNLDVRKLIALLESEIKRLESLKPIRGIPHKGTLTTIDGEHEYSNTVVFLVQNGQNPAELLGAIATQELGGIARLGFFNSYEFDGDWRMVEARWTEEISEQEFRLNQRFNTTPSKSAIRWNRLITQKIASINPEEVPGSVTFVNIFDPTAKSVIRVYVSTFVGEMADDNTDYFSSSEDQIYAEALRAINCYGKHKPMRSS